MNLASIKFKRIDKEDLVLQRWNLRKVLQIVTFLSLLVYVLTKYSSIPDHSFHSKWFAKLLKRKYTKGRWYSENSLDNGSGTCCCSCGYLWMEDAFAQHHLVAVEILKQRGPADYNSPELCLSDCLKCKMRCWPRNGKVLGGTCLLFPSFAPRHSFISVWFSLWGVEGIRLGW